MTNDKVKVGIYCRLSREDGDDKESESIDNQRTETIKYVNRQPNWEVYSTYIDDGYTGLNFDRPEFQRLKDDVLNKYIDVVVCTKQSRLGRDSSGVDDFLFNFLIDAQVRCVGILDGLDNFNKSNKKSAQITGLTNEWYSEEISYSVKSAFDAKRGRGEFIGAYAPYGYKKHPDNKNKLIINEEVAPVIRKIFQLYLDGYGYVKIAQTLNEEKIQTPSQYRDFFNYNTAKVKHISWSYHTVRQILMNEVYIGHLVQKKTKIVNFKTGKQVKTHKSEIIKVENTHEPIIDINTFTQVQSLLEKRTKSRPYVGKRHIFSGIIRCGDCYRSLGYRHDNQSFSCMTFRYYGDSVCGKHFIKLDDLKEAVLNDILSGLKQCNIDEFKKIYDNPKLNKKPNLINMELTRSQSRLDKVKILKRDLYEDYKNNIISKSEYLELKEDYTVEEEELNNKLTTLENEKTNIETNKKQIQIWEDIYNQYINCTEINQDMVNTFIDQIEIFEDKEHNISINIKYKSSVPFSLLY